MFDNLSQRLDKAWDLVRKDGKLTAVNIKEPMREIRRALLEADVRPFQAPYRAKQSYFHIMCSACSTADFQDAPRPSCVPIIHQYADKPFWIPGTSSKQRVTSQMPI